MEGRQAKFAQRSYKRRAVGMREERGEMFPDKTKVQLEGSANVRRAGKQRDTDRNGRS